jgi:hypothetical protein
MDCIAAPFECGVDTPTVALPASDKNYSSVPDASGGEIRDGSYRLTKASFNGDYSSVRGEGLKIRSGYIHRKYTTYNASSGSALTGAELVGEFATTSTSISVETTHCTMGASSREVWGYTATATGLVLFKGDNTLRWAETYVLE